MRVLHVMKVVRIAGAERHLLILLSGLRVRGVDAQIVLLVEPNTPMDNFAQDAAERDIPLQRLVIHNDVDVTLVHRLRALFRALMPDIVHTHLLHADLFGIPAATMAGVPVVTTRHNENDFRRRFPVRSANHFLWGRVDAGITIADSMRRFSMDVEGAPADKLHTIFYGLDFHADDAQRIADRAAFRAELGLTEGAPIIGMVCRLIEQKGVEYGLQAFARARAQFPDAALVIAGDGALRVQLEAQVRALGISDHVWFLGWREDVQRVFAGLDIFLMPSLWEGFGLVILEAMAQRVPIIASAVSAIPEIVIDGETGILVPPRDIDGLASALQTLLGDSALRSHMGLLGQDRLEERFSAAQMVDETLALYQQLLARHRR